jgi:hypothetical protein
MFVDKEEDGKSNGRLEFVEVQDKISWKGADFKRTASKEMS